MRDGFMITIWVRRKSIGGTEGEQAWFIMQTCGQDAVFVGVQWNVRRSPDFEDDGSVQTLEL